LANNSVTMVIRGKLHWAKVLGKPRFNEYSGENEWSVDVTPNAESLTKLRGAGLEDKLRTPKKNDKRTEPFVSFRQKEFREDRVTKERTPNAPIRVVNIEGKDWPQTELLGNDTVADVKFLVRDYGKGKPKGVYIQAIRVLDLVPYKIEEFAPLSDDDEFFAAADDSSDQVPFPSSDDDTDDDVPF
jgi:hypothetical protein